MAKKATDLLDVFRLGSAENASRATRASSARPRKSASRRRSASSDEIQLGGRQLLLASCIGVLLIVLAFTVGLGVGRKGLVGAGPALQRLDTPATRYWMRGELPSHDPLIDAPVNPRAVALELQSVYEIPASRVRIRPVKRGKHDYLLIDVGPFQTAREAEELRSSGKVKTIRLRNGSPFRFAKVVPESADG